MFGMPGLDGMGVVAGGDREVMIQCGAGRLNLLWKEQAVRNSLPVLCLSEAGVWLGPCLRVVTECKSSRLFRSILEGHS